MRIGFLSNTFFLKPINEDENYIKAKELYERAEDYEKEGKPEEFTETYLRALELQKQAFHQYPSPNELNFQILPFDILRFIFSFCSLTDLSRCMQVSKSWYVIARDGLVWKQLFARTWPNLIYLEESIMPNVDASIRDWYTIFKQRKMLHTTPLQTIVIDESGNHIKYGLSDSFFEKQSLSDPLPHKICAVYERVSHIRINYSVQFRPWNSPFVTNPKLDLNSINRHWYWQYIFQQLGVHPDRHPILYSVSPTQKSSKYFFEEIVECAESYFTSPALCFVDSPILVLYSIASQSKSIFPSIVIIAEADSIVITPVSKNKECLHHFMVSHNDSSLQLMKNGILQSCEFLQEKVEKITIVLSGAKLGSFPEELRSSLPIENNLIACHDLQRDRLIGGLHFASLSSFKQTFQTKRIVNLTSACSISNII